MSEIGKFPGRWVVHYEDGSTIVEDKSDGDHWYKVPKEGIAAVGVLLDPRSLQCDLGHVKTDMSGAAVQMEGKKITINYTVPEYPHLSSQTERNYFYIDKDSGYDFQISGTRDNLKAAYKGKSYRFLRLINITRADGTCTVMEVRWNTVPRVYTTNVYRFGGADHDLFLLRSGIDMERWRWEEGWERFG